jgi:hypothetical protein
VQKCKKRDERNAFKEQIKYLRSGDIVIFDRGYFSYDIGAVSKFIFQ